MLLKTWRWYRQFVRELAGSSRAAGVMEYMLLLGGIILPLTVVPFLLMKAMGSYHDFVSRLVSLPFP